MPTHNPEWKDKTCEKCIYRDDSDRCRRFPPTEIRGLNVANYIIVGAVMTDTLNVFTDACAEYKEQ